MRCPGTYRERVTVAGLLQLGLSSNDAVINGGVYTWSLNGGRWSYSQVPEVNDPRNENMPTSCAGFYDVRGRTVTFTTTTLYDDSDCAPRVWTARWTINGNQLIWSDNPNFGLNPWRRIG